MCVGVCGGWMCGCGWMWRCECGVCGGGEWMWMGVDGCMGVSGWMGGTGHDNVITCSEISSLKTRN